ncbi:MAG: hypothetical protein IPK81_10550 [Rhodospirillales bacterium]|nr:MAG: hypothetical protein IPK81_10550 [Rhodospirillales bacterium]
MTRHIAIPRVALLGALLAAGLSAAAAAEPAEGGVGTPRIDQRQVNQERRIDAGTLDGSLTEAEQRRLDRGQARVAGAEARAKHDGEVTAAERARLTAMQRHQSGAIYRQRHDGQGSVAGGGTPHPAGINAHQRHQQARIYAGARDGSLTPAEFRRLEGGQARVATVERRARADGEVTAAERGRIRGMQAHQSRAIHTARHNGRAR